ncbi:hypothetical protein HK105_205702 [Polyrhizophydium stewartii]|uniref:Glycosyltransferase family 92 protein n=1 Tax=Polyrhizophydium stewartii TaxID=2732419 RepID=A0ABR4N5F2_9FUNG
MGFSRRCLPTRKRRLFVLIALAFISVLLLTAFKSRTLAPVVRRPSTGTPERPVMRQVGQFVVKDTGVPVTVKQYPRAPVPRHLVGIRQPEFYLVAAAMMHNKAEYVAEWVEFHLLQGFERFIIYNHMSTDATVQQLEPYIRAGVVELINWPFDYELAGKPPLGPRTWPVPEREAQFEKTFREECLEVRDTWHMHGGCQRTAMMDAVSRYRNRTEWISIFDVDEFFYVPSKHTESESIETITTVRDVLMRQGTNYDHIKVPGLIFGTSGYFNHPPRKNDLPNRLVTEAYRYRTNIENGTRHEQGFLHDRSYSEKSFARARLVTNTKIHHFTFEDVRMEDTVDGKGIREISGDENILTMNHYQYLSHLGQNAKALQNTNWAVYYWRPVDMLFCEVVDYRIGYLVPLLEFNLRRRITIPQQLPAQPEIEEAARRKKKRAQRLRAKGAKLDLCIAFTHVEGEPHHLRRSINTILHHLDNVEADITYKTVLVMNEREAPQEPTSTDAEYLQDVMHKLDYVEILPSNSFWVLAMDRATSVCMGTNASFTLFMEDLWETRIDTGSLADYSRPGLSLPVLRQAMNYMERQSDVLEVWVGDTPVKPLEYQHVRGRWRAIHDLAPMADKTQSNMRVLRQQIHDKETKDAVWEEVLESYLRQHKVAHRFSRDARREYMERHSRRKSLSAPASDSGGETSLLSLVGSILFGGDDRDITIGDMVAGSNAQRHAGGGSGSSIGSGGGAGGVGGGARPGSAAAGSGVVLWENVPSPLGRNRDDEALRKVLTDMPGGNRPRELAAEFYRNTQQRLNCFPHLACPSRTTYVRTQGVQGGSGLAVVRLGGTIKHNGRLAALWSWMDAADASPSQAILDIQDVYGRAAVAKGLRSAHFCLTAPEFEPECDFNPDYISDRATTGIMWRQRLVLDGDRTQGLPDRPT